MLEWTGDRDGSNGLRDARLKDRESIQPSVLRRERRPDVR